MRHHVIIGNGTAAIGAIEGIRSVSSEDSITVVSRENHPVYSRPLISYYLEGKTDRERMRYRDADFYGKNGCEVLYGVSAEEIDPEKKEVILSDGKHLSYDTVCVAAGSSPFVPPMEGLETVPKKFGFMTLDDALALESAITKDSRVFIVGAGLIGLKCAEGIHGRVGSITVCDLADRVLSSILDAECAGIVQKHLENNGIKFLLSDSVVKFEGNKAAMKSGAEVSFDVLVLAVGVRANIGLIKAVGGTVNRGATSISRRSLLCFLFPYHRSGDLWITSGSDRSERYWKPLQWYSDRCRFDVKQQERSNAHPCHSTRTRQSLQRFYGDGRADLHD